MLSEISMGNLSMVAESESSSLMPLVGAVVAAEGIQEEVGLNPGTRMAGNFPTEGTGRVTIEFLSTASAPERPGRI